MAKNQGDVESCNRCGADIVWIGTFRGKRMPVDADTYDAGDEIYERDKHTSHFDTCGKREQQSAPRPAQDGLKLTPVVEKAFLKAMMSMQNGIDYTQDAAELIKIMAENYVPSEAPSAEADFQDDIPF